MWKMSFIIWLVLFFNITLPAQTKLTQEEYAVYASVLKEIYEENREAYSNKSHFVILENTKAEAESSFDSNRKYRNLVKDFKRKNLTSGIIEKKLPAGDYSETYYLVSQAEIDELFEKGRIEYDRRYAEKKLNKSDFGMGDTKWSAFYEKYPEASGYYSLSRVGFNGRFAMVQVTRRDIYSGFSRTYILGKIKGRWQSVAAGGGEWVA